MAWDACVASAAARQGERRCAVQRSEAEWRCAACPRLPTPRHVSTLPFIKNNCTCKNVLVHHQVNLYCKDFYKYTTSPRRYSHARGAKATDAAQPTRTDTRQGAKATTHERIGAIECDTSASEMRGAGVLLLLSLLALQRATTAGRRLLDDESEGGQEPLWTRARSSTSPTSLPTSSVGLCEESNGDEHAHVQCLIRKALKCADEVRRCRLNTSG